MSHGTHYTYNFYVFLHLTEILTKFSPFKLKFKKNQTKVRHKGRNYKIKRVFLKIFFMWCLWGHERPHCLVLSPEASYLACCNSSFSLMKWEMEIFLIDYFVTLCVCAHTHVWLHAPSYVSLYTCAHAITSHHRAQLVLAHPFYSEVLRTELTLSGLVAEALLSEPSCQS